VRQRDRRHRREPDVLCREQAAVSRDDAAVSVDQDRVGEPERLDRRGDLLDLLLRMGARVTRIGDKARRRPVAENQGLAFTVSEHDRGVIHDKNVSRTRSLRQENDIDWTWGRTEHWSSCPAVPGSSQ